MVSGSKILHFQVNYHLGVETTKLSKLNTHSIKAATTPSVTSPFFEVVPTGTLVANIVPRKPAVDTITVAEYTTIIPPIIKQGTSKRGV